ncbi:hypothetical protein LguiA_016628 [Lonicera macranthoides]
MEPNDSGLTSYYHHHHQHQQQRHQPQPHHHHQPTTTNSPTNGILPNTTDNRPPHMVYPNPVPSAVSSPLETVRRKRGRPRKYGTPEAAAAAKRLSSSSPSPSSPISNPKRKEHTSLGGGGGASTSNSFSKKLSAGNVGQGFSPHIITVAAGEDVGQKIMLFMQQSKCEICILSASGSISNASLRQPATSGGNITYEGCFDILSLCGSYVRTELGGRTGGLSVCLSSTDGQIIGGGVGGPLTAAGPVQVIVGTFQMDTKKDSVKVDASAGRLASPVGGEPVPNVGFLSAVDSSGNQHNLGGSQYMIQPRGMPPVTTDWRTGTDSRNNNVGYEFTGRIGPGGGHQSPENGDYEQIRDRD